MDIYTYMKGINKILKFITNKVPKYSYESIIDFKFKNWSPANDNSFIDDELRKQGEWINKWGDGRKRFSAFFIDGVKEGPGFFYGGDGSVVSSGNFINGKKNGVWYEYENGKKKKENYKDDLIVFNRKLEEEVEKFQYLIKYYRGAVISENENKLLDIFKEKYVGDDKLISEFNFEKIEKIANNKTQLIIWFIKKIEGGIIPIDEIEKYGEYIKFFEKNKNLFKQKDINNYKTKEDVDNLISIINQIDNENSEFSEFQDNSKFISKKNIEKLNDVGIYFLGVSEGYQVFYIPSSVKDNDIAFKRYRDILSNCAGREKGEIVKFCTLKQSVFNGYLENDSSLFILYNLSDPNSPYQLSFESNQFKDKNDKEIF